jgi:hypothetical protein
MSTDPSGPPHVNYTFTSLVSGTAFLVTLGITCTIYYYIVISQTWRRWRFCRKFVLGEAEELLEEDLADASRSDQTSAVIPPAVIPPVLQTVPRVPVQAVVLGPLPHQVPPTESQGFLNLAEGDVQLLSSAMLQSQLAIDPTAGQELIDRFFKVHEQANGGGGGGVDSVMAAGSGRHRHLNFTENAESRDPVIKQWKCAWCGVKTSFPDMFNNAGTRVICLPRGVYVKVNGVDARGFGGSNASHQRSKNDLSFDVMPLELAHANRKVFNARVFMTYRKASDLFETPVIESPEIKSFNNSITYTYNVADAYFEWIHPWGEYTDIAWVRRARTNLYLPPTIAELTAQFLDDELRGSNSDGGDGGPATDSASHQNNSGSWMFTDNTEERAHIATTFIPFVVFMTDVHK